MGSNNKGVLVLGATNLPWELDDAFRRRFEKKIYIGLPDYASRRAILEYHIGDTPNSLTSEDLDLIAEQIEGFSGSDISTLCKDAIMAPVRKCQTATRFRKTPEGKLMPTFPSDPDGFDTTLDQIDGHLLQAPPIDAGDMQNAIARTKPTVA